MHTFVPNRNPFMRYIHLSLERDKSENRTDHPNRSSVSFTTVTGQDRRSRGQLGTIDVDSTPCARLGRRTLSAKRLREFLSNRFASEKSSNINKHGRYLAGRFGTRLALRTPPPPPTGMEVARS